MNSRRNAFYVKPISRGMQNKTSKRRIVLLSKIAFAKGARTLRALSHHLAKSFVTIACFTLNGSKAVNTPGMGMGPILERHNVFQWDGDADAAAAA